MTNYEQQLRSHYGRAKIGTTILDGLRAAGKNPDRLSLDDLAPVDQFHIGGRSTTLDLMRQAGLPTNSRLLDVGGGIGGPARDLAVGLNAKVTVLDLSEEYCRVGEMLTARTGLEGRVVLTQGNALTMPFEDEGFDAAWAQHSSMNIANKQALYAEIRRVIRPAGRFAFHEIIAGPSQPIYFPVPWARGPEISFLSPAFEVRALLEEAGFREKKWVDISAASRVWWQQRLGAIARRVAPEPIGLHLLLGPDIQAMGQNILRNLNENRIQVVQGVFERVD